MVVKGDPNNVFEKFTSVKKIELKDLRSGLYSLKRKISCSVWNNKEKG